MTTGASGPPADSRRAEPDGLERPAGLGSVDRPRSRREPAVDVPDDRLEPDPQRLADGVVPVRVRSRAGAPAVDPDPARPSPATSRTTSRPGWRASPGRATRHAPPASAGRASNAPPSSAAPASSTVIGRGSGTTPPRRRGPGLVRRAHPGEVARHGRLAREQGSGERIDLHRREQRIVPALEADRRPGRRRDVRGAQRAAAVRRDTRPPSPPGGGSPRAGTGTSGARTARHSRPPAGPSVRRHRRAANHRSGAGSARPPWRGRRPRS